MQRLLAALLGVLFVAPGCMPGAAAGGSSTREELVAARDEVRIRAEAIREILVDELIERGIYEDQLFADLSQWSGEVTIGHNAAVGVRYYPEEGGATRVRLVSIPVGYDAGFDDLRAELGRLESALHGYED